MKKTLILYELNEVPHRVIVEYIKIRPNSNLAKIISLSEYCHTYTEDDGELHPWSTWPTIHRGVPNFIHKIRFINQDLTPAKIYPPIWEVLAKKGITIGIFGSLQSYPPLEGENIKFYVPDTFSPEKSCFPNYLSDFQEFNLNLAGSNKAIQNNISIKSIYIFIKLIAKNLINYKTFLRSLMHIIKELLNPKFKSRRSLMQPYFGFDIYFKELKKHNPSFSTFFTNHVAGMMHRYWKNLFPEDFGIKNFNKDFHSYSIIKAMDIADKQIGELYRYSLKKHANLWILSSMGQKAIDREKYIGEVFLESFRDLINSLNLDIKEFKLLPAMQPDICINCKNEKSLKQLLEAVENFVDLDDKVILKKRYEPNGLNLNLSIQNSSSLVISRMARFKKFEPKTINKFGLRIISRDIGTGYHTPEGILIACGPDKEKISFLKDQSNGFINTSSIHNLILDIFK